MADQQVKIAISAVDQTKAAFASIDKSLGNLKVALGALSIAATSAAIANFVKKQIDAQDALNDMSERTGVAVDQLSKLNYVAKLSDVSTQQLQTGLIRLNRGMVEAAQNTGEARKAFTAMGISIYNTDGTLKTNVQLLEESAAKFATYEDGAQKTALAVAIFGRQGADLIPLLNQGADGIKKYGDELQRLGGVVTPEAAKQAAQFNDNIDKLSFNFAGLGRSLGNIVLPYMIRFTDELVTARKNSLGLIDTFLLFGSLNGRVGERLRDVTSELDKIESGDKVFFSPEAKQKEIERLTKIKNALKELQVISVDTGKTYDDQISRRFSDSKTGAKVTAPTLVDPDLLGRQLAALNRVTDGIQNNLRIQSDANAMKLITANMTEEEVQRLQTMVRITEAQIKAEQDLKNLLDDKKITLSQYNSGLAAVTGTTDAARQKAEQLFEAQQRLNASVEYGASVALQKYMNEAKKVSTKVEEVFTNAFRNMEDSILQFVQTGKFSFKNLANSIISDMMRIVIQQSITAPLAGLLRSGLGQLATSMRYGTNVGSQQTQMLAAQDAGIPLATGTNYVPYDGFPAMLHKGEAVIPAKYNPAAGGVGSGVVINQVLNVDASADKASIARALEANKNQTIAQISDMMRRNNPAIPR